MSQFTLADDDEKYLYLVHHLLAAAFPGSSFATFSNGEDALSHILHSGTQVLITDHAMGELGGTELIRELRRRGYGIPIIMVSGNPDAEQEALEAGADLFLQKDIAIKRLATEIRQLTLNEPSVPSPQ